MAAISTLLTPNTFFASNRPYVGMGIGFAVLAERVAGLPRIKILHDWRKRDNCVDFIGLLFRLRQP